MSPMAKKKVRTRATIHPLKFTLAVMPLYWQLSSIHECDGVKPAHHLNAKLLALPTVKGERGP